MSAAAGRAATGLALLRSEEERQEQVLARLTVASERVDEAWCQGCPGAGDCEACVGVDHVQTCRPCDRLLSLCIDLAVSGTGWRATDCAVVLS